MGSSPSRVHPQDVLEAKIIPQSNVNNFDGHCNELPALIADIRLVTTCPDIIVIGQIDIET
jgi:hypothetical protein